MMAPLFWKDLTVMSPGFDGRGKVIISNPLIGNRVEVGISDLLDLLAIYTSGVEKDKLYLQAYLTEQGFLCEEKQIEPRSDLEHWERRGWDQVLEYYLWSHVKPDRQGNMLHRHPDSMTDIKVKHLTNLMDFPEDLLLGEVILRRRTLRRYADKSLAEWKFSGILWYGLSRLRNPIIEKMNKSNSLGVYIIIYSVEGIEPGLYRYYPQSHGIELLEPGMLRGEVSHLLFGQSAPLTAACSIFLTVDLFDYAHCHHGEDSLRGLLIEVGRFGHELLIAADALGLGGLTAPALREREAEQLLPIQKARETILYTITLGAQKMIERSDDNGNSNAN